VRLTLERHQLKGMTKRAQAYEKSATGSIGGRQAEKNLERVLVGYAEQKRERRIHKQGGGLGAAETAPKGRWHRKRSCRSAKGRRETQGPKERLAHFPRAAAGRPRGFKRKGKDL